MGSADPLRWSGGSPFSRKPLNFCDLPLLPGLGMQNLSRFSLGEWLKFSHYPAWRSQLSGRCYDLSW